MFNKCSLGRHSLGNDGFRFTLMCYNILAPGLLEKHSELYQKCDPTYISWENRLKILFAEIEHSNADIICLQEVEVDQYESTFEPRLNSVGKILIMSLLAW